jgi:hypothetical protein
LVTTATILNIVASSLYIYHMEMGHWILPIDLKEIPIGSIGFVYKITNKINGKQYIGKKLLENKKKRRPLKGRKNSRRYTVESDWKEYTGSSPKLNADILSISKENFQFEILTFHPSKLTLAYYETKTIIDNNAIFSKEYYNEVLNCRFRNKK